MLVQYKGTKGAASSGRARAGCGRSLVFGVWELFGTYENLPGKISDHVYRQGIWGKQLIVPAVVRVLAAHPKGGCHCAVSGRLHCLNQQSSTNFRVERYSWVS